MALGLANPHVCAAVTPPPGPTCGGILQQRRGPVLLTYKRRASCISRHLFFYASPVQSILSLMRVGICFAYPGFGLGVALDCCFRTTPIPFCAFNALLLHPFGFFSTFPFSLFAFNLPMASRGRARSDRNNKHIWSTFGRLGDGCWNGGRV